MQLIWNKTAEYYEGTTPKFNMGEKIASFDLDGTLITPKSKKKFAIDSLDWMWTFKIVPDKLRELFENGYSIIIISNQAGISDGKQSGDEWIEKLNAIVKEINIEMKVFCSTSKNKYRKPLTTFRDEFFPKKIEKESFYCGDAVGRKGDFTDTDYKFALNAKLNFYTPENIFLGEKNELPELNYCIDFTKQKKNVEFDFEPKEKEMIIMVGFPGSGKSHISNLIKTKYEYENINQDILKTKARCIKEATKLIKSNKSIIIDSTNPSKEKRKEWIDLAKDNGYSSRVIMMQTNIEKSKHNNIYRSLIKKKDKEEYRETVPDIAYNMYKSKFEKPELSEGIDEIILQDQGIPKDEKYWQYLY
jgi:bifunctional polynucleotide phosphatase/kinase